MEKIYTVTELNKYIKSTIENDSELCNLQVSGEVSNFKRQQPSGHCYFSLKDKSGVIKCVMFRFKAMNLRFNPKDGETVIAIGHIGVYEPSGMYQLYVDALIPKGEGDLMLEYKRLKEKLEREGLFDSANKPALPEHPKTIGVVTSPTGAVIRDIMTVSRRRNPGVKILLFPVNVQGKTSSYEVARAIRFFNRQQNVDVLIVGRGGGSMEDLWSFNEEKTVRAVAASRIPVISAVGHETDVTLCDFAASRRAATPSHAAEMAVPDASMITQKIKQLQKRLELQWLNKLNQLEYRLQRACSSRSLLRPESIYEAKEQRLNRLLAARALVNPKSLYEAKEERLQRLLSSRALREPLALFAEKEQRVDMALQSIEQHFKARLQEDDHRFELVIAKLEGLNPLSILSRGYSMSKVKDKVLTSVEQVSWGEEIVTDLADGTVYSVVQEVVAKNGN